jgi:5'(3')-deoxyribonucleotidase
MKGAEKVLGHPFDNAHRKENGDLLNAHVGFWETLPPMPDWKVLWGFIEKFHPHILTAVPSGPWGFDFHKVERGKREWYRRHIPSLPQNRIHVVYREQKSDYAVNNKMLGILIDDNAKNVQEFTNAGGIGVLHHNAKSTIILLKNLGYH